MSSKTNGNSEPQGEFDSVDDALTELRRRAGIAWDHEPNKAPCGSWKTCGRRYEVIEFDDSMIPWKELRRAPALEITAVGSKWLDDFR